MLHADHFRAVVEAQSELIALADPHGELLYGNPACARHFGTEPTALLGRRLCEALVVGDDGERMAQVAAEVLASGTPQHVEARMHKPAGEAPRHVEVQLIPDVADSGAVQGYFYTALDVTERSRAEHALRALTQAAQRQSEVLRLVTEAIPATVVVVGGDGRYRFANSAFAAYSGLAHEHIIGRTAVEVLGPEEVARRRPFMGAAMKGDSVTFALDHPGDDGPVWLELNCIPLRSSSGTVDGFVGVSQDITRERREQDRLTALAQRDPLTGLLNRAGFEQFLDRRTLQIGASVGVGFGVQTRGDWQALITRADTLLYQAKRAGRGRLASG